jgi:hypothetical protein
VEIESAPNVNTQAPPALNMNMNASIDRRNDYAESLQAQAEGTIPHSDGSTHYTVQLYLNDPPYKYLRRNYNVLHFRG